MTFAPGGGRGVRDRANLAEADDGSEPNENVSRAFPEGNSQASAAKYDDSLHAQGYEHETNERDALEMEALEVLLLQSLGYANPYA